MNRIVSDQSSDWVCTLNGPPANNYSADNDGVMGSSHTILVDLSQALSQRLGRQMSMMSTYKVDYVRIDVLNVDDLNDNNSGVFFQGQISYHHPTAHKVNAMQLARQIENADGADEPGDMFGPLDNQRTYKGMRFGWSSDNQVAFQTGESFSVLSGQQWDLAELFTIYEASQTQDSDYTNALWTSGRCGYPNQMAWSAGVTNMSQTQAAANTELDSGTQDNWNPTATPYESHKRLDVLGGLLLIETTHSCVDDGDVTTLDDNYQYRVTVGVSGWSDF
tara:strand:+ start:417 stop:1247 length:831 start_codon:yes stop_codon:yes gene_type:complete